MRAAPFAWVTPSTPSAPSAPDKRSDAGSRTVSCASAHPPGAVVEGCFVPGLQLMKNGATESVPSARPNVDH
jgi:hypothetical protein